MEKLFCFFFFHKSKAKVLKEEKKISIISYADETKKVKRMLDMDDLKENSNEK